MRTNVTVALEGNEPISACKAIERYVVTIGSLFLIADDPHTLIGALQRAIDGLHDAANPDPTPDPTPDLTLVNGEQP